MDSGNQLHSNVLLVADRHFCKYEHFDFVFQPFIMIEHDTVSWVSVIILSLAVVGVASNIACVVILIVKKRSSMFHKLLKVSTLKQARKGIWNKKNHCFIIFCAFQILSFYDTLVIIGCSFLYALPGTWSYFTYVIYPV